MVDLAAAPFHLDDAVQPGDEQADVTLTLPMGNGLTRLQTRFFGDEGALQKLKPASRCLAKEGNKVDIFMGSCANRSGIPI